MDEITIKLTSEEAECLARLLEECERLAVYLPSETLTLSDLVNKVANQCDAQNYGFTPEDIAWIMTP